MGSLFSRWVLPTGFQTLRTFFLVLSSSSRPPACSFCLAESPGSDRLSLRNPVALCHPLAGPSAPILPRQRGISHQGLSAPILAQAERHLPPGPVRPLPCAGRAASPTGACQSPPLLDHPQLVSRSLLPVCHPGHGGHAPWPPGPGPCPCLWRTALLLLSPAWLHLRPQWRHPGPPASSDPAVCTPHWPPHLPGVGITRFLETSVPGLTSFHPVCWRQQLPECRGPLTTSPGLT